MGIGEWKKLLRCGREVWSLRRLQDCRLRIEERRALVVIVLSLGQLKLPMSSWGESAGDGGLVALVVLLLVMSPLQPCPGSDSHPWCCCYWFNSCVPAVSRFCCCVLCRSGFNYSAYLPRFSG